MSFLIVVGALFFLMFMAYRGFSVILFAPIAAMLAVLLTDPATVPAMFIGSFAGAGVARPETAFSSLCMSHLEPETCFLL
jgi:H+/gluconate symporter-like permease